MKKFEWIYRGCLVAIFLVLVTSVIAAAQETTINTNAPAPAKTTTATVKLPVLIEDKAALSFGLDRVIVLQPKLWGNPRWQYVASLIYILLAFYISKIIDFLTQAWLKKLAARTKTRIDDLLLDLLRGPVKVVAFVILLHVGLNFFDWPVWVRTYLSKGMQIVVACWLTYLVVRSIDLIAGFYRRRGATAEDRIFDDQLFPLITKSLKVFVVIVAVLVTLQNLGINITGMIASLSIGGLAIGLAAQDTLANLFGAVAIFADKPFRIGDVVKVEGVEGFVESIGMRSTRIRNFDGHLIAIPNKTMGNAIITNITRRATIRTVMNIGLTYDTPRERVERAAQILQEVYGSHPMSQQVQVVFNKFADSALNIEVIHWWKNADWPAYLVGLNEMNLKVKERFDAENLDFAFPSRTVYVKNETDAPLPKVVLDAATAAGAAE